MNSLNTHDVADTTQSSSKNRTHAIWIIPFLTIIVVAIAVSLFIKRPINPPVAPLATVEVSKPLKREVRQWDAYVGRFAASKVVEVRPRVGGAIVGVHFQDGAIVKAGQLLFTIDPRPYRAALAEAQAGVAAANSDLLLARANYDRALRLKTGLVVTAREVDALKAKEQAAKAKLDAAQARVDALSLDVEFTQIRAPIEGRISDRRVDAGNLVVAGGGTTATLLTTINALDPIYFIFDASESLYLKTQSERPSGGNDVEVRLQGDVGFGWRGKLDFTDNGVDFRSGTVRGRAIIPNPSFKLIPGLFGDMRMANTGTVQALLVPDTAIQSDQADKAVLVVDTTGIVVLRQVTLGPVVEGLRIITSGLKAEDSVIIAGTMAAMPGKQVKVTQGHITPRKVGTLTPVLPAAAAATLVSN